MVTKTSKKNIKVKGLTLGSTVITFGLLLVLLTLCDLIFTSILSKKELTKTTVTDKSPSEVTQDFYTWYMGYKGNSVETGAYKLNSNLSTTFINDIDNRVYKNHLNYDPFVCSADRLLGISVVKEDIVGSSATVLINEDFGEDKGIYVHLVLEDTNWKISAIDCPQIEEQRKKEEDKSKSKVVLFLTSTSKTKSNEDGCKVVYEVERVVEDISDPLTTAMQELFKGPTKAEGILGYTSVFSEQTTGIFKGLRIADNKAYVSLRGYDNFISSLTTCEVKSFENQIEKTIRYYKSVGEIIYQE